VVDVESGLHWGEYTVLEADGHALLLGDSASSTSFSLPIGSIWRLQVRRLRSPLVRGAIVGGIGFLVAGGAGAAVGYATGGTGDRCFALCLTGGETAVLSGGMLGAAGFVVGFLVGFSDPGFHWQTVGLPTDISVRPEGPTRAMISFSYRM
jgi:hypothetical protein